MYTARSDKQKPRCFLSSVELGCPTSRTSKRDLKRISLARSRSSVHPVLCSMACRLGAFGSSRNESRSAGRTTPAPYALVFKQSIRVDRRSRYKLDFLHLLSSQ